MPQTTTAPETHLSVDIRTSADRVHGFLNGGQWAIALGSDLGLVIGDPALLAALAGACESGAAVLAAQEEDGR